MSQRLIITNHLRNKPINAMYYRWGGFTPTAISELQRIILFMSANQQLRQSLNDDITTKDDINIALFKLSQGIEKEYPNSIRYIKKFGIGHNESEIYASELKPSKAYIVFSKNDIEEYENYGEQYIDIDWKITNGSLDIENSIVNIQYLLVECREQVDPNKLIKIPLQIKISELPKLISKFEKAANGDLYLTNGKIIFDLVM